ncbi:MAG: hypothetical protein V4651_10770, partial [Bacteroidota bacterium]
SNKINPKQVFKYEDWGAFSFTLVNMNTLDIQGLSTGSSTRMNYFFYKNGLFLIDQQDTFPFPVAYGNHTQFELFDFNIRLTSPGSSYGTDVFEKATKASLEKAAADFHITDIDTMAYLNRTLMMK